MNYIKIHEKFISYFKSTTVSERLKLRNRFDYRLTDSNNGYLYTEIHHITPRSLGGLDTEDNLIRLLPEEHLFIHELRFKAFNCREDMLAVRLCVNGYNKPTHSKPSNLPILLTKAIRKSYSFIKTHSANFRKIHGWQTKEGRNKISESRKGTMPAISVITGESVGAVSTQHPKVLSGEYVHHSKGFVSVYNKNGNKVRVAKEEYTNNKDKYTYGIPQAGTDNPRYSGYTDNDILDIAEKLSRSIGIIVPYGYLLRNSKENLPKSLSKMRFNGNKVKGYVSAMQKRMPDLEYNPHFRDEASRKKSSESSIKNNKGIK